MAGNSFPAISVFKKRKSFRCGLMFFSFVHGILAGPFTFMKKMAEEIVLRCAMARAFLYRPQSARILMEKYGSVECIYENRREEMSGAGELLKEAFASENLKWAEEEVEWCSQKGVKLLFNADAGYPTLLQECNDAPFMLYYKGTAKLDNPRCISVVGTRLASSYGKECCSRLMDHIAPFAPLVVSGLAYGIDIESHKCALEQGLETVAVLPNGINLIYPSRHRNIAVEMTRHGGILTEFPRGTPPQRVNFIKRNRIIAAMSQALVVVESRVKGGSMITAEFAAGYNREIFAMPGRITDPNSFGCNYLISKNVASIYSSASTIPSALGWSEEMTSEASLQPQLFSFDVEGKEKILLSLRSGKPMGIEAVSAACGMDWGEASMLLLELELEGKITVGDNMVYKIRR